MFIFHVWGQDVDRNNCGLVTYPPLVDHMLVNQFLACQRACRPQLRIHKNINYPTLMFSHWYATYLESITVLY